MKQKYYCPTCKKEIEVIEACGSSSYFCNYCKKLISKGTVLEANDVENTKQTDTH